MQKKCHNINHVVITSKPQKEAGYKISPGGTTSTTIWHMAITSAKHNNVGQKTQAITSAKYTKQMCPEKLQDTSTL